MKIAKKVNNLSDMKVLSLSHVFPINNIEEGKSVTKLLDSDGDKKILLDNLYSGIQVERASAKAVNYCKDISDNMENEFVPDNDMDQKSKLAVSTSKTIAITFKIIRRLASCRSI